jgi:hypothetical protein
VPFEAPAEHPVVPNGGHDIGNHFFRFVEHLLQRVDRDVEPRDLERTDIDPRRYGSPQRLARRTAVPCLFSGTPSRWSIVASDAELSPALNVSVGGIGMTSSGRGEAAAAKIIAGARAAAI